MRWPWRVEKRAAPGGPPSDAQWFATDTHDPLAIRPDTAPLLAPVFGAWRHIVDFVSTLPVDAFRANPDGSRSALNTLPPLLRSEQDPTRPGVGAWFGEIAYGIVSTGNAVGLILERDGMGFPSVVRWLHWSKWAYDENEGKWYVGGRPMPRSELLHVPWIVPTGMVLGLSPIEHMASLLRAGLSAQDYADLRRGGGGLPPAIIKNTARTITPEQGRTAQSRAIASWSTGKPWVTGNDWEFTAVAIPPNHVQFIETLKLSATEVAAVYGIDPREIGGHATESLTYATDESKTLNRASNLRPYIVRIEQAISRVLPERQFIKLNIDSTIRTDIKTRVDVIGAQLADGRLNVNEARALEDLGPVPGGDVYKTQPAVATPNVSSGAGDTHE